MTSEAGHPPFLSSGARRNLAPLEFTLPPMFDAADRPRRSLVAVVMGLSMYGMAVWLVAANDTFRRFEAYVITPVAAFFAGRHRAVATDSIMYFNRDTAHTFGLDNSSQCTSALLLIPLLVMMGSFAVFTRFSVRRQLFAMLTGALLIVGVNVGRASIIAWATWKYGPTGFSYSHVFVGSAFSLVGFVGAMLVALWILVRTERMKQAAVVIRRAFWIATAPAMHRLESASRGAARGRPQPAHRYRRRR